MNRSHLCWLASIFVALAGCGQSNTADKAEPPPPKETAKETVFDDLTATKERARKDTEQAMQQSKERVDAALEQSEAHAQ